MKSRVVTVTILLILSEALGVGLGEWFFRLFVHVVPAAALSGFNTNASHLVFLTYGAGAGVVLFVWFLLGMAFGGMGKAKPSA
jgi:hypothetical protein